MISALNGVTLVIALLVTNLLSPLPLQVKTLNQLLGSSLLRSQGKK